MDKKTLGMIIGISIAIITLFYLFIGQYMLCPNPLYIDTSNSREIEDIISSYPQCGYVGNCDFLTGGHLLTCYPATPISGIKPFSRLNILEVLK